MNENKNKLSQEDLLRIVWEDIYRLLSDISRTFSLLFYLYILLVILVAVLFCLTLTLIAL